MPRSSQSYLRPVVGYFMWYLQHGYTEAQAIEHAKSKDEWISITDEQYAESMAIAKQNIRATLLIQAIVKPYSR